MRPCFPSREEFGIMSAICESPTTKQLGRHYLNYWRLCPLHFTSFFESNRELCETTVTIFYFFFHSKENKILQFSDIQVSWRHLMPEQKAKNTFYRINLEVKRVSIKSGQCMSYYKIIKKNYQKSPPKLQPEN